MATALPLELPTPEAPAVVTPDDRRAYETDPDFRSFVDFCVQREASHPDEAAEQIALAQAYAGDFSRERADLEAGRHPMQRPR
jgi:hypothetical protein